MVVRVGASIRDDANPVTGHIHLRAGENAVPIRVNRDNPLLHGDAEPRGGITLPRNAGIAG